MNKTLHTQAVSLLRRIDERLAALGLSDLAATEKAGIHRDAIRNIRRGQQRELSASNTVKLAEALEITPNQLLGLEPMPEFHGTLPEHRVRRRASPKSKSEISVSLEAPKISGRRVPVLGLAVAGDDGRFVMNGELIDSTFCPPGLEDVPGVYAVYVSGSTMEPRFEPGETVWVHPRKPVRPGNYVVAQIQSDPGKPPEGFIRRFVKWTEESLVLEQINPVRKMNLGRDEVVSVHPIVFQGIA